MDETGIVPLVARFLQNDGINETYVEFYPHISALDGASYIKPLIVVSADNARLIAIVEKMGEQMGRMFALDLGRDVTHPDCHPGNFLVCDDGRVLAIDCRGPLVEGKAPALLFLARFARLIQEKLSENMAESTDLRQLHQNYTDIFSSCRAAFITGMVSGLGKKDWLTAMGAVLTQEQIMEQTEGLKSWTPVCGGYDFD